MSPKTICLQDNKQLFAPYKMEELLGEVLYSRDPVWAKKAMLEYNRRIKGLNRISRCMVSTYGPSSHWERGRLFEVPKSRALMALPIEQTPGRPANRWRIKPKGFFGIKDSMIGSDLAIDVNSWKIGQLEILF